MFESQSPDCNQQETSSLGLSDLCETVEDLRKGLGDGSRFCCDAHVFDLLDQAEDTILGIDVLCVEHQESHLRSLVQAIINRNSVYPSGEGSRTIDS